MNKDKRNNIQLLGTLNNADESGIIANANQIYDANEDKSTQDVSKEHTERIKDLETKEDAMQTTLENISKTGEASAASNVTYNHSDSKLDATNVQQAVDEVRKRSNYNDGDSIIDFNTIHLITNNPEFICVAVDADDRILYGVKTDGQPYFGVGCPQQVKDYIDEQINKILGTDDITTTIDSLKEIEAFLKDFTNSDTLKKLLDLKANVDEVRATTDDIYKKSNPNDSDGNVVDTNTIFSIENNPEYIKAITDSVGKLIESTNVKGKKTFYGDVEVKGDFINEALKDKIEEYADKKVDKVDGKTLIDKNVANILSTEDNAEYLDVKTDSENKIVSYRDTRGILHEQVGVSTNTIFLGKYKFSDISDIKTALINYGIDITDINNYKGNVNDLSDKAFIKIKEPRFAIVNITGIAALPTAKGQNYHAYAEVWDLNGNYFKKKVILNPQGNSSMGFPKKNIAMDFCEDDWEGDNTTSIQIGDWVAQDSFHHKSYYCDIIRGIGAVSYKIYEQAAKTFGNMYDKPWKKALIDMSKVGAYTSSFNNPIENDLDLQFDNGALCHPDGFPEAIYLNGEFYGIFSWQLKKHRDNYHLDKNNTNHIHLDGTISSTTIFNTSGNIVWGTGDNGFEIRNPKSLCYAEYVDGATGGFKYDADVFQGEIAGVDKNYAGTYNKSNTYTQNQLVGIEIDGKTHYFICSNADMANVNAPSLNNNTDKNPDFKGKTKTGWINATVSVNVKNNLIKMSKYIPELKSLEIVTATDGNIRIGNYLRELTDLSTIHKGNYTKVGDKYYMAIHSSTTSSDVTDTSYWMDITANVNAIRTKFETYFDTDNLALFQVISDVLENKDGVWKNWQWFTYGSVKWYVGIYDTDMTFGMAVDGDRITPLRDGYIGNDSSAPLGYFQKYYTDKLDALYKKLADNGIITVENIMNAVREWTMRIGTEYYKLEYKKWSNSPCNNASVVRTDYWKLLYNADGTPQTADSETFDATKSYAVGDTASFGANDVMGYYLFECVKATEALESNTPHAYSTYSPISKFNHYDNIYRIEKWIEKKLKITDKLYNYTRINN